MKIQIISVGAPLQGATYDIVQTYTKRLPTSVTLTWCYIKHGNGDHANSMRDEAEKILSNIPNNHRVILLDERGKQLTSEEYSTTLFSSANPISIIIGGAYGVDERVTERADIILSLSKLVFPHQLVRVLLAEQIYRAHTIHIQHPYHHS